jgi:hypothetical protein
VRWSVYTDLVSVYRICPKENQRYDVPELGHVAMFKWKKVCGIWDLVDRAVCKQIWVLLIRQNSAKLCRSSRLFLRESWRKPVSVHYSRQPAANWHIWSSLNNKKRTDTYAMATSQGCSPIQRHYVQYQCTRYFCGWPGERTSALTFA